MQPRGTHGDVISTTEPETYYNPAAVLQPRSHSVPMHEWPILLGLSLGKSLSIPITAFPLAHAPLASTRAPNWNSAREHQLGVFIPPPSPSPLFHLPISTYLHVHGVCGTKISFFTGAWDQDDGLRAAEKSASCVADFFHYDSLNHNPPR